MKYLRLITLIAAGFIITWFGYTMGKMDSKHIPKVLYLKVWDMDNKYLVYVPLDIKRITNGISISSTNADMGLLIKGISLDIKP